MSVLGIDHVEFYVEDAERSAAELAAAFGLRAGAAAPPAVPTDPAAPRTVPVVRAGIRLLFTSAADPAHPAAAYVARHGDGVGVLAMTAPDPAASYDRALAHGARPVDPDSRTVAAFDDLCLRFTAPDPAPAPGTGTGGLDAIDHFALCVPAGGLAAAVRFCEQALGFREIFQEYIEVGDQGMDSTVVQSPSGDITFTLLEPDTGRRPGQIDEFLRAHDGVDVQHIALRTDDIVGAVRTLGARGVGFLTTPGAYYDALDERLGDRPGIAVADLRELHILLDQDHGGHLFQIFARSTHPRGTFFFELVERRGASTFGTANITALYEAVERGRAAAAAQN